MCVMGTPKVAAAVLPLVPQLETKADRIKADNKDSRITGHRAYKSIKLCHSWKQGIAGARCTRCWAGEGTVTPCGGRPRVVARVARQPNAHYCQVFSFGDSGYGDIVMCRRCGAWASARLHNLAKQCPGKALVGSQPARVIARVVGGMHPMQPGENRPTTGHCGGARCTG